METSFCKKILPLAGLVGGILAVRYLAAPVWTGYAALLCALAGTVAWALAARASRRKGLPGPRSALRTGATTLLFAGLGVVSASWQLREHVTSHPRFDAYRASLPAGARLLFRLESRTVTQYGDNWRCRLAGLALTDSATATEAGAVARASLPDFVGQPLRLRFSATPFRAGDIVSVPAASLTKRFVPMEDWAVEGHEESALGFGRRVQRRICVVIEKSRLAHRTKGFLAALIAGEQGMLDRGDRAAMADAGVAHILAVSGMHVGIIAALVYLLLRGLNVGKGWRWRRLCVIPVIWLFALASGFAPSVVRASVMLTVGFFALSVQKRRSGPTALLAAALVILLFDPASLWHIGFQLSFVCVAAILLFVEPLNPFDRERHPLLWKGMALVLVPVVASLSTWVLSAYWFGKVPLAFLPLNLVAVPLLPFYMALALLHLGAEAAGLSLPLSGDVLDLGYEALTEGARLVSVEGASVWEVRPELTWVFGWFILLAVAGWILHSRTARRRRPADGAS